MPFLLAEILNFQGSTHLIGVGSLSYVLEVAILHLQWEQKDHSLKKPTTIVVKSNDISGKEFIYDRL